MMVILYVENQQVSNVFYESLFGRPPLLDVPGMTEFELMESCKLGLVPNSGIASIISGAMPHPSQGTGIPRCELYLPCEDVRQMFELALSLGATAVSSVECRDWGDTVGYVADLDGHILAFAHKTPLTSYR